MIKNNLQVPQEDITFRLFSLLQILDHLHRKRRRKMAQTQNKEKARRLFQISISRLRQTPSEFWHLLTRFSHFRTWLLQRQLIHHSQWQSTCKRVKAIQGSLWRILQGPKECLPKQCSILNSWEWVKARRILLSRMLQAKFSIIKRQASKVLSILRFNQQTKF